MGKFKCNNKRCSARSWSSKNVAILIRGYPENGYNAVVFNQRSKSCNELGQLTLDKDSYVERVAYRIKKWAGVEMEPPHYAGKIGPPYEGELCEGCKAGYCGEGRDEMCEVGQSVGSSWKGRSVVHGNRFNPPR